MEKVQNVFNEMDEDESGTVDREEFEHHAHQLEALGRTKIFSNLARSLNSGRLGFGRRK